MLEIGCGVMKYFKGEDILLADFDGVLLDSQEKYNEIMGVETDFDLWMEYLNSIDWHSFLRSCNEIEGAVETFLELQKLEVLKVFITRIHSFDEGREKCMLLRDIGLYVPVYYVLPTQQKSMVYLPNKNVILLDDDPVNTIEWEINGGKSLLYNKTVKKSTKKIIKKIPNLLK